jgi:hypothetical protein
VVPVGDAGSIVYEPHDVEIIAKISANIKNLFNAILLR